MQGDFIKLCDGTLLWLIALLFLVEGTKTMGPS